MADFFNSRAGRQLLLLSAVAFAFWIPAVASEDNVLQLLRVGIGAHADSILLTLLVAGITSVAYSALRIYDLRKEMVLRRQAEEKADWTATHDQLTRLPNRYAFERVDVTKFCGVVDSNGVEIAEPSVTVYSLDLDGFKKVNDLVGHWGGDALLKEVARRLCQLAGISSVFRFGGDEFIVLANNLPLVKADGFARLMIQAVTRPILIDGIWTEVGASVGYARWPQQGRTLEDVSHNADMALYEAKSAARNNALLFSTDMHERVAKRARLEEKLRQAIQQHLIQPFYQPLINLKTGDVCGFEALARWIDEDGDFVSPQVFIALAEETGLITELFHQLLVQACEDARTWPEHLFLSFNVSPVQMEDRLLPVRIQEILDRSGLTPRRLEVEITENALAREPAMAANIIDSLHEMGIQIALDDFGTGYSNLSQLARYRFDRMKIDKSLAANVHSDERQQKIIQAVLGLSQSLNLATTVEGVEEHSQLAYFLQQGCDVGQGYLFGKAMPADAVQPFLDNHAAIKGTEPKLPGLMA
jgi:diguanylate cyclase (GGDEF)-like protein